MTITTPSRRPAPAHPSTPPGPAGTWTVGRPRRRSAAVAAVAVVGALLAAALLVAPAPAAAHGPDTNGCTAVPDAGYGFDFHDICDRHDVCYGTQPHGSDRDGRKQCDRIFRSEMLDQCREHPFFSGERAACTAVAVAYYIGVRAVGWTYWERYQPTPMI
ncbi:MAG: phospholipase A2 [Actinomycetota bacterium]